MHLLKILVQGSLGKKLLMAMSGAGLSLFLLAHLLGNLQALSGRGAFLAYAERLHGMGWFIRVLEIFLALAFLLHIVLGLSLFLENRQARPDRYATGNPEASPLARFMPYTGLLILLFLLVHLSQFHFGRGEQNPADLIRAVLSRPEAALFYLGAMVTLFMHTSHGFWSMFQTLGLNHRKYNHLIQTGMLIVSLGLGLGFASLPLLALFWKGFLI